LKEEALVALYAELALEEAMDRLRIELVNSRNGFARSGILEQFH
jgi:hypothetical protein